MENENILRRNLELEVKRKTRRTNLKKIILATVGLAGMMAIAAVAPNILGAMGKLGIIPRKRQKEFIEASRGRLIKAGFLTRDDRGMLRITPAGKKYLLKEIIYENFKNKKRKWDGKWRVLIFDIPEKRKLDRDRVRYTFISLGFMRLQDSVWIYPYDCEDLVTLLKADLKMGKDILYMIVDALEYDKPVRLFFGLLK